MPIWPALKSRTFLIAVAGGMICLIAAFIFVSDLSPVSLGNSSGEFIIYAYNLIVTVTFPAIMADVAVHRNVHQYFHVTYFIGVFVEGFVITYVLAGLAHLVSRHHATSSGDAA